MQCVHYPKIIPKRAPKNHISFNQIVTKDNRKPQARLIRALGSAHKWKQACVVRQQNIRRSKKKKKKKKKKKRDSYLPPHRQWWSLTTVQELQPQIFVAARLPPVSAAAEE